MIPELSEPTIMRFSNVEMPELMFVTGWRITLVTFPSINNVPNCFVVIASDTCTDTSFEDSPSCIAWSGFISVVISDCETEIFVSIFTTQSIYSTPLESNSDVSLTLV